MALQEEFEAQGNYLFKRRGGLPVIILLSAVAVQMFANKDELPAGISPLVYEMVCLFIGLIGVAIRSIVVGYRAIGTSGRNTKRQVAEDLNSTGLYSTVRHPLYVGNFFMSIGVAMLVQHAWFIALFAIVYWFYYERIMFAEEQFLRKQFGSRYLDWAAKTPAVIPSFKNYTPPSFPINWKDMYKDQANCLTSLFGMFLFFKAIDFAIQGNIRAILNDWSFYATLISLVLYGIIKFILKKRLFFKAFKEQATS